MITRNHGIILKGGNSGWVRSIGHVEIGSDLNWLSSFGLEI